MRPLTRNQVRRVDRLAIEDLGIAGVVLMENAGRQAASAALELLARRRQGSAAGAVVAVVCGGGNNGGDGYVVARHLHNAGAAVAVYAAVDPQRLAGDALANWRIVAAMGLEMRVVRDAAALAAAGAAWGRADLIVDALLGTGFFGEVRPPLAAVIEAINAARRAGAAVLAIDVPSGLDCDSGRAAAATVCADMTVTFVAPKVGFDRPESRRWLGELRVADIGAPPSLVERVLAAGDDGACPPPG